LFLSLTSVYIFVEIVDLTQYTYDDAKTDAGLKKGKKQAKKTNQKKKEEIDIEGKLMLVMLDFFLI